MYVLACLLVTTTLLCVPVATSEVVDLNDDNFWNITKDNEIWAVAVVASWCSHCKRLKPVWNELAVNLPDIKFGRVDGTQNPVLVRKFQARGFPTISLIKDGYRYTYSGRNRDTKTLTTWINTDYEKSSSSRAFGPPGIFEIYILSGLEAFAMQIFTLLTKELVFLFFFLGCGFVLGIIFTCTCLRQTAPPKKHKKKKTDKSQKKTKEEKEKGSNSSSSSSSEESSSEEESNSSSSEEESKSKGGKEKTE